ncbi:MAG: restriction endonuclease, partial [Verrucomicrobia bacterium]
MSNKDYSNATIWGIHAGRTGEADSLFLKKKQVALGWNLVGDLSALAPNREAFKEKVAEVYPERKKGYYPVAAGQIFRFLKEVQVGD